MNEMTTRYNFLIPISCQPVGVYLSYLKLWLFGLTFFIIWVIKGCKDIRFSNFIEWQFFLKHYNIFVLKDCSGKMKGGKGWDLDTLGFDWDILEFYLMFLSREINIKLCQSYTKTYIYEIWYKNLSFETDDIQQIRNQSENYDNPEEPE